MSADITLVFEALMHSDYGCCLPSCPVAAMSLEAFRVRAVEAVWAEAEERICEEMSDGSDLHLNSLFATSEEAVLLEAVFHALVRIPTAATWQ